MKTNIEIPAGHKIEHVNLETGEVTFRKLTPAEGINTFQDILDLIAEGDEAIKEYYNGIISDSNHTKAYKKLILIVEVLNSLFSADGGLWEPRFNLSRGSSGFRFSGIDNWHSLSYVGSRLRYTSKAACEFGATKFLDIYKEWML